jgi:AraC-like DNA-binding protein
MGDLSPFVAGPATRPTRVAVAAGMEIIGVRFRPGVAHHLLGVYARDLRNQNVPLRDVWAPEQAARWEAAMERPALSAKLEKVAEVIAARLVTSADPDPFIRRIVGWIVSHPLATVEEIAQRSGLSERQLRRRFDQTVGYGPKTLQRVLRMQRLLWLASAGDQSALNLTRLAFAAGYADQPHMTREVVTLTGATPGQLLRGSPRGSAVSELFKTTLGKSATLTLPE